MAFDENHGCFRDFRVSMIITVPSAWAMFHELNILDWIGFNQ